MSELPDKPSELLRVTAKDFQACIDDPKYNINMATWHRVTEKGRREVCIAGAVMAKTLKTQRNLHINPEGLGSSRKWDKLYAINEFREGNMISGLCFLDVDIATINNDDMEHLIDFAKELKTPEDVLELAGNLEKIGL